MSERYKTQRVLEVWTNDDTTHWEIGMDRDALGLCEIREFSDDPTDRKIEARMTFEREAAIKIAEAILEYCNNDKNFEV